MKKTYPSRVSAPLAIICYGLLFGIFVPLMLHAFNVPVFLLFLFLQWLITRIFFGISYTIDGNELIVKSLFFNRRYDVRKITKISPSHHLIFSPAASLDRLELQMGNETLLVSPRQEQCFIEQICEVNPHVVVKA